MENNFKLAICTGFALTVSLASALHATTARFVVPNEGNTAFSFHSSKGIVLAQVAGPVEPEPEPVEPAPEPVAPEPVAIEAVERGEGPASNGLFDRVRTASTSETDAIVLQLEQGADLCGKIPEAYRIDCLSLYYRETAKKLASRGDYGEARTVLLDTANQLDALVQSNRDSTKPRIHVKEKPNGRKLHKRALTPVKPQSVASVKRQAIPILEEASTKLLRSASSSSIKSVHYQRIAAAVSSNKVLLRSS